MFCSDKLKISFVKSSAPGGSNVNKVNTKAEIRFKIVDADWLPVEAKEKIPLKVF